VLQTGEFDFAWNLQVADEILKRLEQGGKGHVDMATGGSVESIKLNNTDPWKEVDGERSSVKAPHPFLTDPSVRTALSLLVDRASIQEQIYGRLAQTTANYLNAPAALRSKNTRWEFNPDKAAKTLEDAGWRRGSDGVRAKNGKRLRLLYQTSINAPRQKTQAVVKQAAAKAGIEEGMVSGGGVALVQAGKTAFDKLDLVGDEATGVNIVKIALDAPLRQIAVNAGLEGGVVVEKVRGLKPGFGLDAATGEYVDMLKAGIIDPAKVTRSALQNAASIAALFLTTEAVVADKPEKEKASAGMPGGGGDMDF